MIGTASILPIERAASPAPAPVPANAPELLDLVHAARALLRVDDLHLDNSEEKAALREALVRFRRRRP